MNFSFVQISDHHILPSESDLVRGFSPSHNLRAILNHIAANVGDRIDFILSTGDVTNEASDAAYRTFSSIAGLEATGPAPGPQRLTAPGLVGMPIYFQPGNHDDRDLFYRHLAPGTAPTPLHNFSFEHKGIRFVLFDQGTDAKATAFPESVSFLAAALADGQPTIVITHHHLLPVENKVLDDFLADDLAKVWDAIRGKNVLAVIFGHVHTTYEDLVEGIPTMGVRATAFQFALTDPPTMALLPPHYRLVTVQDEIVTSRVFEVTT